MKRTMPLALVSALVLMLSSCGKDVTINVNDLPCGNGFGSSATGTFTYTEVVTKSTCPESAGGVALPQEGDTWETTANLVHGPPTLDEGCFMMTLEDHGSHPEFVLDGGMYWYGNFRIGGSHFWDSGEDVTFINLVDGRFVDGVDDVEGTTQIRVQGPDDLDCEITVKFNATRD